MMGGWMVCDGSFSDIWISTLTPIASLARLCLQSIKSLLINNSSCLQEPETAFDYYTQDDTRWSHCYCETLQPWASYWWAIHTTITSSHTTYIISSIASIYHLYYHPCIFSLYNDGYKESPFFIASNRAHLNPSSNLS